ncbi:carbohydrate-binding domain-containing protein [Lactonifactor longoviformis]|uniref:carbohydrate-binding domain-containing protein n=1 Tax=Lactonifactor longoviformis TaxID=341220 RepID=UPI0027403769|nr:carbohydrate-binding domain-containing protein [Lactonifactor longoviformis]
MKETEERSKGPKAVSWRLAAAVIFGSLLFSTTAMAAEGDGELWVNGQNILEAEQNTVPCGAGTAVYDASRHVLTLNSAVIETGNEDGNGISVKYEGETPADLTIQLAGNSRIQAGKEAQITGGIFSPGGITVQGNGALSIEAENGIYTAEDLRLKGGSITVKTKEPALQAEQDIGIEGVSVVAHSSENMGICAGGAITVKSGNVSAKGGPGMPGVAARQTQGAEGEEPELQIVLDSGYTERNGGEAAVTDWFQEEEETAAWSSFVNPGEKGKLSPDFGNAMNEVRIEKKGSWIKDRIGWWYQFQDKSYPVNQWKYIDRQWYYFNGSGYMATGWLKKGNTWYYLKPSGAMATGWCKVGNTWYYLKDSGAMAKGWVLLDNTWYYLRGDGAMATGWLLTGGKWYYLKSDGSMAVGWLKLGSLWYYLEDSGAMATGWRLLEDEWYYLKSDGSMAVNWCKVGNTWYYLRSDGRMATGWLKLGKTWYYLKDSGAMVTGLYQVAGKNYVFDTSGAMKTGWAKTNNIWYYLKSDGAVYTGWLRDGNTTYYLKEDGAMATGWFQTEDEWYYADSSGAMAVNRWIGNYYVGSTGAMHTSGYTPDGYYVDADGKWMPLSEDDIKTDGDRLVTKYYYFTLPETWNNRMEYFVGRGLWAFLYADTAMDGNQKKQEELFTIEAVRTEQEAREYAAEMEDGRYLGQHSGLWFIAGGDENTVIDLYTKAQQAEIQQMHKDVESILDSLVFR